MEMLPQLTVDKVKVIDLSTSETSEIPKKKEQIKGVVKKIKKLTKKEVLDKQANKAHLLLEWRK